MNVIQVQSKDNKVEAIVEVEDDEGAGNVRLQLWEPKNKRNKCTVLIAKLENQGTEHVGKLAKNIIKPLLNHLLVNIDTKNFPKESNQNNLPNEVRNKIKIPTKVKHNRNYNGISNLECDSCGEHLQSVRSLRRHNRTEHIDIETQPLAGIKRKSAYKNVNVINPRQDDPTASPPLKLRVVLLKTKYSTPIKLQVLTIMQR